MPKTFTLQGINILSKKYVPIDTSTSGTGAGSRGKGMTLDLGNGTPTSSAGRERRECLEDRSTSIG